MARRLSVVACCLGLAFSLVLVPGVGLAQGGRPALRDLAAPTRRTDLRRTPTTDPSVRRTLPARPRLLRPGATDPGAKAPAGGSAATAPEAGINAAPAPADATSSGAPAATVAHAFVGLDDQNEGACASPSCVEPPDPWVAVGPNDVVQVVNATLPHHRPRRRQPRLLQPRRLLRHRGPEPDGLRGRRRADPLRQLPPALGGERDQRRLRRRQSQQHPQPALQHQRRGHLRHRRPARRLAGQRPGRAPRPHRLPRPGHVARQDRASPGTSSGSAPARAGPAWSTPAATPARSSWPGTGA